MEAKLLKDKDELLLKLREKEQEGLLNEKGKIIVGNEVVSNSNILR
jgi:hypothetical protein